MSVAPDLTARSTMTAIRELEAAGFIIHDAKVGEVFARRFIADDQVLRFPNITKAMVRAANRVKSEAIREAILHELTAIREAQPELKGWLVSEELFGEPFRERFQ